MQKKNRKGQKLFHTTVCVYVYIFIFFFYKKMLGKHDNFFNYIINSHLFAWSVVFVSFGSCVVVGWKEL